MQNLIRRFVLSLIIFGGVHALEAGKLREFAEKATGSDRNDKSESKPDPKPDKHDRHYHSGNYRPFGSGTYPSSYNDSFFGGFWAWVVTAPFHYRPDDPALGLSDREAEAWAEGERGVFPLHRLGEPTVPYVRTDYSYQKIDGDIDAQDIRLEVGWKAVAFHGRTTMYEDASDGFEVDINQYYALLRYGGHRPDFVPGTFEAAFGIGVSEIKTNDSAIPKESAGAITIPLKYYPTDWFGVEFRSAWYSWVQGRAIGDYDINASIGSRFVQLRGGYRLLYLQGEGTFNDGPYAGVTVSF